MTAGDLGEDTYPGHHSFNESLNDFDSLFCPDTYRYVENIVLI